MGQPTVAFGKGPLFSRSLFSSRRKCLTGLFPILPTTFSDLLLFSSHTALPPSAHDLRLLTRTTDSNKNPVSIVAGFTMPFVLHVSLEN